MHRVSFSLRTTLFFIAVIVSTGASAQTRALDSLRRAAVLATDSLERYKSYFYVSSMAADRYPDVAAAYADSAHSMLLAMGRHEMLAKTFISKGLAAQKKNDLVLALHWYEQALENARKYDNLESECFALLNMAAVCVESGEVNRAIELYRTFKTKVAKFPGTSLRSAQVTAQVGLGIVLKNQNRLAEAAVETKEGLELAIRYGFKNKIWDFYDNLGLIYGRMGDYRAKLDYHRKAAAHLPPGNTTGLLVYNNLGNAFLQLNQLDSADFYFQKVARDPNTKWKSLIHTYNGLSQVHFERGQYTEALEWSERSAPLADRTGNALTIVGTKTKKAKALMGLKRYDESINLFNALLALMDANKDFAFVEERAVVKRYLAQALALKNGTPEVAELIEGYAAGRDSIHNFIVTQSVEELRVRYETRLKEDSLRILEFDRDLKRAQISKQRIFVIMGFLLAAAALVLLFYAIRRRGLERQVMQFQIDQLHRENKELFQKVEQQGDSARSLLDFANESIVLNGNDKSVFRIGDIFYIQSQGNGVQVVTADGRRWRWQTMQNLEKALPNPPFFRPHRSFLVNGMHIRQYRADQITMGNGDQIPVGITQATRVEDFLRRWLPELA